jgi:hypothetical protein
MRKFQIHYIGEKLLNDESSTSNDTPQPTNTSLGPKQAAQSRAAWPLPSYFSQILIANLIPPTDLAVWYPLKP